MENRGYLISAAADELLQAFTAGALKPNRCNVMCTISSGLAWWNICTCGQARYKPLLLDSAVALQLQPVVYTYITEMLPQLRHFRLNYCNR
jgi:hypothetical protein